MAKATMPIPWDWNGEDWKCWAIEWPDSPLWNAILEGFVTQPMKGRFWDERTGSVTDAQAIGREIDIRNHPNTEVLMACNEETTAILQGILDQLTTMANRECCPSGGTGGSRGAGSTQVPENPYPGPGPAGGPPPGFEDEEEWRSHQCNQAEDIINALKSDLLGLSGIVYSGSTPTGLVGYLVTVLLTPIPFDDLVALLGYLIYSGYNYSLLAEMAAQIGEEQSELRCVLATANTVESAENSFLAALQEIATDTFTLEVDAEWVMGAIEWFVPHDSLNRLFTDTPTISQSATCECTDECTCSGELHIWTDGPARGTIISTTPVGAGFTYVIEAEEEFTNQWRVDFYIATAEDPSPEYVCNRQVTIEVVDGSVTPPLSGVSWRGWEVVAGQVIGSNTEPDWPACLYNVSVVSQNSFELEVTIL